MNPIGQDFKVTEAAMRYPIRAALLVALVAGFTAISTSLRVSAAETSADPLQQARGLLDAHQGAAAYQLLAPLEPQLGGSEDYDYMLGLAALDSGHASEAVFSLERVLAVDPAFLGARMELARARYESGDAPGARSQFQYPGREHQRDVDDDEEQKPAQHEKVKRARDLDAEQLAHALESRRQRGRHPETSDQGQRCRDEHRHEVREDLQTVVRGPAVVCRPL